MFNGLLKVFFDAILQSCFPLVDVGSFVAACAAYDRLSLAGLPLLLAPET